MFKSMSNAIAKKFGKNHAFQNFDLCEVASAQNVTAL
jgi:hypothetical protein